jgi:carbohydrate kinase (thermoresistant glucokinase family)
MVILVMGTTGAGKTTVAKLLSARLDWIFLDADDFHPAANIEKMQHGIALTDADRIPWLDSIPRKAPAACRYWQPRGSGLLCPQAKLSRSSFPRSGHAHRLLARLL